MATEKKMITLKSSDGKTFNAEEAAMMQSQLIKHMVEDGCANTAIPLPNVAGSTVAKVIEYCNKHATDAKDEAWDAEFVKYNKNALIDLMLAGHYLCIQSLVDLMCQAVADFIKGKTPEEIRRAFNIKYDFNAEEGEEIRKENQWVFE